jgi:hypothetical protein
VLEGNFSNNTKNGNNAQGPNSKLDQKTLEEDDIGTKYEEV